MTVTFEKFEKDGYTSVQVKEKMTDVLKTKYCPDCNLNLPRDAFSSTRAKRCLSCKRIRQLEQAQKVKERAMDRLKTKKAKTRGIIRISDLKNKVQRVFNKWIRERDKDLPCISCGKWANKFDAGHFWAMGSNSYLRYNEDNCHKQCSFKCNKGLSGNQGEYRIQLIKKIGLERVDWLEDHRNEVHKWTREELETLLERYKS